MFQSVFSKRLEYVHYNTQTLSCYVLKMSTDSSSSICLVNLTKRTGREHCTIQWFQTEKKKQHKTKQH